MDVEQKEPGPGYMRAHAQLWTQLMESFLQQPTIILYVGAGDVEKNANVARWLADNVLRHKDARLFCCDAFTSDLQTAFEEKTRPARDKIVICRGLQHDFLKSSAIRQRKFYAAFVDIVGLPSEQVIERLVLVFRQLHFGGLLIVDALPDSSDLSAFVAIFRQQLTVLTAGSQLILRRSSLEDLSEDRRAIFLRELALETALNPPPPAVAAHKLDICAQLFRDGFLDDAVRQCDQIIAIGAAAGAALRQAYINRAAIQCAQGAVAGAAKTLGRAIQNGVNDELIRSEAARLARELLAEAPAEVLAPAPALPPALAQASLVETSGAPACQGAASS
jgi:hypothetical protein